MPSSHPHRFAWPILAVVCNARLLTAGDPAETTRLKDLVTLEGMRDNQLVGYGLVVGLAGTGDKRTTVFSTQSLANMLQRMGVTVDPTAIQVKNTAAVVVTSTLPAFAQPGTHIDVTASAIGDAANLQGGILVLTSLRGANGQVYATAQGPVVTGGFAAGRAGNSQTVNHPTVGRVPNGATVERAAPSLLRLRRLSFSFAKPTSPLRPGLRQRSTRGFQPVLVPKTRRWSLSFCRRTLLIAISNSLRNSKRYQSMPIRSPRW